MTTFAKGMRVYFETPEGRVHGTVMRVNAKTVSVDAGRGDGGYFRVPPELLHPQEEPLGAALGAMKIAQLRIT